MDKTAINESNKPYSNFLYFTAYALLNNTEKMQGLKPSVSSLNLKRAQWIVNLNQ